MKLLFRQRLFSWFDSYDIYDEAGNTVYTVQGRLSWGHRLEIYDARGEHLGTVKEEVLTFLPRFALYQGGRRIGEIKKEFTFFKPVPPAEPALHGIDAVSYTHLWAATPAAMISLAFKRTAFTNWCQKSRWRI